MFVLYELVTVSFRSRSLIEALVAGLPGRVAISIVDNADGVDHVDEVGRDRPRTRHVAGPGGFAAGANLGARTSEHDIVVFVNPDTSPTADQLDRLVSELLDSDEDQVSVAATTVLPDGRVELGNGGWEPTARRALVHACGLHRFFRSAGIWAQPRPGEAVDLDWLSGACLAVRRERFLELGGFDEDYPLYNEDMSLGRNIRQANMQQTLLTDVLVPHLGGGSGGGKTHMQRMQGVAMMAYLRRTRTRSSAETIRFLLSCGVTARLATGIGRGARHHRLAYLGGLWSKPTRPSG